MVTVNGLVWDEWNKEHIAKHDVSVAEVEEVCKGEFEVIESYRNRILVVGKTQSERTLVIILSPEDRDLQPYGKGIYYPITAFEKEVEQ